jgi:hypothetical protein
MTSSNVGQSSAKRITCSQCGANNYVGGTHCWQCGKPLNGAVAATPATALPQQTYSPPSPLQEPQIITAGTVRSPQQVILPGERVDPDLAMKAAAALGFMFPIVGLPVGIVFLMLDDARKVKIGWATIWWSVAGSAIGIILSLISIVPFLGALHGLAPHGGGGNPLSSLNSPDLSGGQ